MSDVQRFLSADDLRRLEELPRWRSPTLGGDRYNLVDGTQCYVQDYQAEVHRRERLTISENLRTELTPGKRGRPSNVPPGEIAAALAMAIDMEGILVYRSMADLADAVERYLDEWGFKPRHPTVMEFCSIAWKRFGRGNK